MCLSAFSVKYMCQNEKFLTYTATTITVLREMSHQMHDSGESLDVSVFHTVTMTSPSVCQSHDSSVCQPKHDSTWNCVCQ